VKFWHVLALTGFVAALLLIVPLFVATPANAERFCDGLGDALIIAIFLALTVDTYVKRRLAREIAKNVSSFMMVSEFPKQLQDEFVELTRAPLYRKLDIFYRLERISGSTDRLRVTGEIKYTVYNLRKDRVRYQHHVAVQKAYGTAEELKSTIFYVSGMGCVDNKGNLAEYEETGKLGQTNGDGTHTIWQRTIYIPEKGEDKGEATFRSKATQILPEEDEEVFINILPTTEVDIRVDYPDGLTTAVQIGHRLREEIKPISKKEKNSNQWSVKYGMLPYQPIVIQWRKVSQT